MRKPLSHLLSSSKSDGWHQQVKSSSATHFLVHGSPETGFLPQLKRFTDEYLTKWNKNLARPSTECDAKLSALIAEHANKENTTREVAIIACFHALSPSTATQYLISLMEVELLRYLRCVTLASQVNPSVVSEAEYWSAKSLLGLLSKQGPYFSEFQVLIEATGRLLRSIFLPLPIINRALEASNFCTRFQGHLDYLVDQRRYMSAFNLVSWLQSVPSLPDTHPSIAILNKHFPTWTFWSPWRPNINRIRQWEEHRGLKDAQRRKLSRVFDLEGPDTTNTRLGSLKLSNPKCYEHVRVRCPTPGVLDQLLDVLDRALDPALGTGGVDLFIHLCIDNLADDEAFSMVNAGIRVGNDSSCRSLLSLLLALSPESDLSEKMTALSRALPNLNTSGIVDQIPFSHLIDTVPSVMDAAQAEFCTQLEVGTGEYFGMLLYEFGQAILKSARILPTLPEELISKVRHFPSQEILEAIFDQLQTFSESSSVLSSRFKSYLASSLGSRGAVEPGMLSAVREELRFWASPLDTDRRDIAKVIAEIQTVNYGLYVSCLLQMLEEADLIIQDIKPMIRVDNDFACISLARYFARRRELGQFVHECWLSLLSSLMKDRPLLLPSLAKSLSIERWIQLTDDFCGLISDESQLPQIGPGLTRELLSWWTMLSQRYRGALQLFSNTHRQSGNLGWLFVQRDPKVRSLLEIVRNPQNMTSLHRQVLSYLSHDGSNVSSLSICLEAINATSTLGRAACERILRRKEQLQERWPVAALEALLEALRQSRPLSREDKSALRTLGGLIGLEPTLHIDGLRSANERLQAEYDSIFEQAQRVESLRMRLHRHNEQRTSAILARLGIEDTKGRIFDPEIPEDLVHAVEIIGEGQYELCFSLTTLNELQRQARGIDRGSRMLLIRICLRGHLKFCIHFSPNGEFDGHHDAWLVSRGAPDRAVCTTKPNLFTYLVGRNLHRMLSRGEASLQSIYTSINSLIRSPVTVCLVCCNPHGTKLWKPVTCSPNCTMTFRGSPLEARLHGLLIEPLTIDLLLTCIYATAADQSGLDLLPGCPVNRSNISAVIDSLPPLTSLSSASDLRAAIRGGNDGYSKDREDLLSWLCLKFRGFMVMAPDGFRVPSMPNTRQFLLLNSCREREQLFSAELGAGAGSGVVFHGTQASRLFLILSEGLKVMTGGPFMMHGGAGGVGIYCGDELATSLSYSGNTGQSWRNSQLSNMSIMLGCELAAYTAGGHVHIVNNENRLLVRYVFLLPQLFQPPLRRHVEPAMNIAFAKLRSGLRA